MSDDYTLIRVPLSRASDVRAMLRRDAARPATDEEIDAAADAAQDIRCDAWERRLIARIEHDRAAMRAAREAALREAAAVCDARREVYEKKLTDEAAIFAAAYEIASGLILALIDEEPT